MTNQPLGGGKPVGFASDIRPLFMQIDIDHMNWYCDLSSYNDAKTNAQQILRRLKAQGGPVMPPPPNKGGDGPWSADKIALFESWITDGYQP
jgi:hypothetical protein